MKNLLLLLAVVLTACGTKKSIVNTSANIHSDIKTIDTTVVASVINDIVFTDDSAKTVITTTYYSMPDSVGKQHITSQTVTTTIKGSAKKQQTTSVQQFNHITEKQITGNIEATQSTKNIAKESHVVRYVFYILLILLIITAIRYLKL